MVRWRCREVTRPAGRIDCFQLALRPAGNPLKIGYELIPEQRLGPPVAEGSDHRRTLPHTGVRSIKSVSGPGTRAASFDELVGAGEDRLRHVRPSVLVVLRLTTSSNLVGCCTGRSAGLAPLRIRPT